MHYLVKSNENEVNLYWFKKINWNKENYKFNEKWNNIFYVRVKYDHFFG